MKKQQGYFITFEGPEGSGKTTQMRSLGDILKKHKVPFVLTREPGGSRLSTHLRRWILNRLDYPLSPEAELFLFLADRAQHVEEVLRPALKAGKVVLCDRYTDSTLAYQGGGRGFDMEWLKAVNQAATGGLTPNLTLLFDLPVEKGLERAKGRGKGRDRMEREKGAFHRRVRQAFLKIARAEKHRMLLVDASGNKETVFREMTDKILRRLPGTSFKLFKEGLRG